MSMIGVHLVLFFSKLFLDINDILPPESDLSQIDAEELDDSLLEIILKPGGVIETSSYKVLLISVVLLILRGKLVPISRIHQIEAEKERWFEFALRLQAEREKQMEALAASVHGANLLAEKVVSDGDATT